MKIRTRFAPSPTGKMHVGNLRTALYAFLIAKHEGGDMIIRIEDTDQKREMEGAVDIIFRTLEKTGISYDEGPDKDGGCGPYVQSQRKEQGIYMKYARELVEKGEAYYCFCDEARLSTLTREVNGQVISHYDKHCLHLPKEEVEANLATGKPFVIRQNNPDTGTTTFVDELYGDITVSNEELDDMILIKSDGYPTYNFANVVDDHLMGITHVVRGNEYLSSSPKYNRLYEAFGWDVPVYIHCPLITDENHQKLSKRSGHSSFEDLLEQGFVAGAIVNFVALLGWSPQDNREIYSLEELIAAFDYHHMSKSPAVFDMQKLRWMNGEYLKAMPEERYMPLALPYLRQTVQREMNLEKVARMLKTRIETLTEIPGQAAFLQTLPEYSLDLYSNKKMKTDAGKAADVLGEVQPLLAGIESFDNDTLFQALSAYAGEKGYKVGYVMWPLRIAISGLTVTPGGATELMELLGKSESLRRISLALERLQSERK